MRDVARTDDELALFRDAAGKSLALVPLVARGRSVGVLTVGWQKPGWRPTRDEWSLIEALAQRIALAVDGALQYQERAYVARTLQQSLLPGTLPSVPGVDLAAEYVAGGEGMEVGGDFFDVFAIGEEDEWAVVIGDVCGKGAEAAAVTALARVHAAARSPPGRRRRSDARDAQRRDAPPDAGPAFPHRGPRPPRRRPVRRRERDARLGRPPPAGRPAGGRHDRGRGVQGHAPRGRGGRARRGTACSRSPSAMPSCSTRTGITKSRAEQPIAPAALADALLPALEEGAAAIARRASTSPPSTPAAVCGTMSRCSCCG